jgi:hypothetical protein
MWTHLVSIGIVTCTLCSCAQYPEFDGPPSAPAAAPASAGAAASPPATAVVYAPPRGGPAEVPVEAFGASRFEVVRSIEDRARGMGLEVIHRDNSRGLVVAHYQGPALNYLDCGTYSMPATAFSVPAGGSGFTRAAASASGAARVNQETQLNARLIAMVERQGDAASRARVEAQYVLRRDLVFVDDADRMLQRSREFIDLTTDRPASFSDDTACSATGELERSILPKEEIVFGS